METAFIRKCETMLFCKGNTAKEENLQLWKTALYSPLPLQQYLSVFKVSDRSDRSELYANLQLNYEISHSPWSFSPMLMIEIRKTHR